jgi:hypothetical protein
MGKKKHPIKKKYKAMIAAVIFSFVAVSAGFSQEAVFTYRTETIDLNLQMDVTKDADTYLSHARVDVITQWAGKVLCASYYCQNRQVELGLSTKAINSLLPGHLQVQFKATPDSSAAVLEFSLRF